MHNTYNNFVSAELNAWQQEMLRPPTFMNAVARKMQYKLNSYIPDKVHAAITTTIKQMIRGMLFGAGFITTKPIQGLNLQQREIMVLERIKFYQSAAAAEGGVTGAGGILLGLADFPLLLSLKLKLLFEIATIYGYDATDYRERVYLLHIFQLAFSSHEHRREVYQQMVDWETQKLHLPEDIHDFNWRALQQEYRDYIDLAKMAQMIPLIGAPVGAVVNYRLVKKLGATAMNAYRMRWKEQQLLQSASFPERD